MDGELKVFGGRAHPSLVEEICEYLQIPSGKMTKYTFSDGEIFCQIDENVRGSDIFVVQPTCHPVNENLMELLIMLDAFKRSSASRVTAVIPYYGYARQDKKDQPRVPITAKLVADLLTAAGASRILAMDLHAPAIQGFFDIPVDHLFAAPVMIEHVARMQLKNLVVVAPDAGGVERARAYGKRLGAELAIIDKRRDYERLGRLRFVRRDGRGAGGGRKGGAQGMAGAAVPFASAERDRGGAFLSIGLAGEGASRRVIGASSSGKTLDFGSSTGGSNPPAPASGRGGRGTRG